MESMALVLALIEPQRQVTQDTPTSNHGEENQLALPVTGTLEVLALQDLGT